MTTTSTNKNLLLIIAVLLLTNIAVLVYFLWYKVPGKTAVEEKDRNGIAEPLQKEVGFNEEQLAQYKMFKEEQRETIRPMFDDMRKSKDSLFRLLSDPAAGDSVLDRATDIIAEKQKRLDLQTFSYFKKVRGLCRPEQEAKYDSLILRMFRKMGKPKADQDKAK